MNMMPPPINKKYKTQYCRHVLGIFYFLYCYIWETYWINIITFLRESNIIIIHFII